MTIAITSSGISLDGPLVAGEKVAVTVSGLALAAEDKPTLALLARFPDALLASVELAEDAQTPGTWTGELDTATKQTALFFATARADERRDAALELVSGRASLARLAVPMANSALCPKPDGSPFASPVYVPVPGPPGQGGDPYDQNPAMDGTADPGVAEEYARGDHVHPTDTSRASASDLATVSENATTALNGVNALDRAVQTIGGMIPSTASSDNKLATAADVPYGAHSAPQMDGEASAGVSEDFARADHVHPSDTSKLDATFLSNDDGNLSARSLTVVSGVTVGSGVTFGAAELTGPQNSGHALTDADISEPSSAIAVALAAKADTSSLAAVATSGDYGDLLNKPTIPAAQVNADWNAASGVAAILNKPTIPEVRYALTAKTPSVSGTSATVACEDRAINDFTVATGITSLTITPPAAVTGRARDFFCRVTLTDSSLPTVTLSGATVDIGATEVAGMTQGVNLLMFTEISSGHWLASRRSAS